MTDPFSYAILVVALLIVMGAFVVGTQWNIRKGNQLLKWLQQGLALVSDKTTLRWLGSSVVELKSNKAKDPFRQTELLIVLEPRDVPPLWLYSRLRGRRDLLIFRTQLRDAPANEFEIFDPNGWSTRHLRRTVQNQRWTQFQLSNSDLVGYSPKSADAVLGTSLLRLASFQGTHLIRLALHRTPPNLEIHLQLADTSTLSSLQLVKHLQETSRGALEG